MTDNHKDKVNDVLNKLFDIKEKISDGDYKDIIDSVMNIKQFVKVRYMKVLHEHNEDQEDEVDMTQVESIFEIIKESERCLHFNLMKGQIKQQVVDDFFEGENPSDTCRMTGHQECSDYITINICILRITRL